MARNTGRGSRIAARSPRRQQFVEVKTRGGEFLALNRSWWHRLAGRWSR